MTRAELAGAMEIPLDQLVAYESGERVSAADLFALAKIVGVPIGYFYEGLPDKN
jgi:transcriptional regulator with XRE-family HTH domain